MRNMHVLTGSLTLHSKQDSGYLLCQVY